MGESQILAKVFDLGTTGLLLWVAWKLLDKWAGKFLDVHAAQAGAMQQLASAVKDSQGEQREVLLAVRVLASKIEDTNRWIRDLDFHVRGGSDERNGG